MKAGSKYHPLFTHLQRSGKNEITLALASIEAILGVSLPASARTNRSWWSNRSQGAVQANAWMKAGYHVVTIDLKDGLITFRKPNLVYNVQRDGDTIIWDGKLVKALRHHMGLSQTELADKLGMRQQTISEWETEVYRPKRSTSRYLMLIAEQAGFQYGSPD